MAHLQSAHLSRGQSVVAIAGATGRLGSKKHNITVHIFDFLTAIIGLEVSRVFLSRSYRPFFSRVICMTRDSTSDAAKELAELGGEICLTPTLAGTHEAVVATLTNLLRGVDIVVNVLGSGAEDVKEALLDAAINSRVKVYFPSEFGM